MRVNLGTINIPDEMRRAINQHHGKSGLATRSDVYTVCHALIDAGLEDIASEEETEEVEHK